MGLLFDVGLFETQAFLLVDHLQQEAKQQGGHAKAGQHHQRGCVVVAHGGLLGGDGAVGQSVDYVGVGLVMF